METEISRREIGGAQIVVAPRINRILLSEFKGAFADGAICVVYDEKLKDISDGIAFELKRGGYRVSCASAQAIINAHGEDRDIVDIVPEYVRYVFAIGAGTAAHAAKRIARALGIEWSIVLTAPSTDTIMCGNAPKQVFIDKNILLNCPVECVAAGWGIVLSQQFKNFEEYFAKKVLADSNDLSDIENADKNMDNTELALKLLEISATKKREDGADIIAHLLRAQAQSQGKKPRSLGEYKFIASSMLTVFYSSFLGAPSIDAMPPACRQRVKAELEALHTDFSKTVKNIDFFDVNSYFRISYILSEYRMDLLDKLSGIDVRTTQRFWRRLYPDAGYWLKSELSQRAVLNALSLAGELSDNLLGYAYSTGFTEAFGR